MSNRIRFHLDENVHPTIAKALHQHGIDVTTTAEMGLLGQPDGIQFNYICVQERVIVTQDADFLRIASQTSEHPGIVYCRKGTRTLGEMIRGLVLLYEVFTAEETKGHVECL